MSEGLHAPFALQHADNALLSPGGRAGKDQPASPGGIGAAEGKAELFTDRYDEDGNRL